MAGDRELEQTLDAIEADLAAVEHALDQLDDPTSVDLSGLDDDVTPGRLAEHLAASDAAEGARVTDTPAGSSADAPAASGDAGPAGSSADAPAASGDAGPPPS
jgi:hypothetical protein